MKKFFDPRLKRSIKPKKGKKQVLFYNPNKFRTFIFGLGTGAVLLCFGYLVYLWLPLAKATIGYYWRESELIKEGRNLVLRKPKVTPAPTVTPMPTPKVPDTWDVPDENFSIYIPKLESSAKVFTNVDPGKPKVYLEVLKDGVAHAAGSGFPGSNKTIYLFAHSTNAEWNVVRYNAVFFLLNKLETGDRINVVYKNRPYIYEVFDKKIVGANDISYLTEYNPGREEVILQTCWPPGTIIKRLLVFGKRI